MKLQLHEIMEVFPTHVGVFLGDKWVVKSKDGSSPRTWGCFYVSASMTRAANVFPTHVGVFLKKWQEVTEVHSLPHARGGVSTAV